MHHVINSAQRYPIVSVVTILHHYRRGAAVVSRISGKNDSNHNVVDKILTLSLPFNRTTILIVYADCIKELGTQGTDIKYTEFRVLGREWLGDTGSGDDNGGCGGKNDPCPVGSQFLDLVGSNSSRDEEKRGQSTTKVTTTYHTEERRAHLAVRVPWSVGEKG